MDYLCPGVAILNARGILAEDMEPEEVVLMGNFTLMDAMSAFEVRNHAVPSNITAINCKCFRRSESLAWTAG